MIVEMKHRILLVVAAILLAVTVTAVAPDAASASIFGDNCKVKIKESKFKLKCKANDGGENL